MALVLRRVFDGYRCFMTEYRDARSIELPLAGSPWPVISIVSIYLFVVLKLGPELMQHRKAFDLKHLIRAYNAVQVIANGALFLIIVYLLSIRKNFSYLCQPVNYTQSREGYEEMFMAYCYFLLKVLDLADTVFFVLRKKQSHVSFLHVYHHAVMVLVTYLAFIFVPGGQTVMLGIWNTLVHAVMYFYYFVASYGNQYSIWWKKYITLLQLVQFVHLGLHFGIPALFGMNCGFPRFWLWIGFLQAAFILTMFADFYVQSYVKKRKLNHKA
ncbi:elongation of very long chain fatty acids protein AAEL008004-like [Sabethes cyaneus]|uniref:elongation of very long chain fatty acids protein AAEL008004-like n=1 Tax=Sabethes cyaneus TaxID=53552 RepID=UPI00237EC6BF|nr:elongation of very long chain fatty acids protein AAEL008004-like [Sabethes cyaneus]